MFSLVLAGRTYSLVHFSLRCWAAIANLITAKGALGACARVFCLILDLNKKLTSRDLFIIMCDLHALEEKRHSFQCPLPSSPLLFNSSGSSTVQISNHHHTIPRQQLSELPSKLAGVGLSLSSNADNENLIALWSFISSTGQLRSFSSSCTLSNIYVVPQMQLSRKINNAVQKAWEGIGSKPKFFKKLFKMCLLFYKAHLFFQ